MITCEKVKQLLQAYVDNELDEEITSQIDAHIEGCDGCENQLDKILDDPRYYLTPEEEKNFLTMYRIAALKDEDVERIIQKVRAKYKS